MSRGPVRAAGWIGGSALAATLIAPRDFSHWRPLGAALPLYPLDLALGAGLVLWLIDRSRGARLPARAVLTPLAVFVAWGALEAARGAAAGAWLRSARDFALNDYTLVIPLAAWIAGTPATRTRGDRLFVAAVAALAVKALVAATRGWDIFPEMPGYAPGIGRYLHGAEGCFLAMAGLGLASAGSAGSVALAGGLLAIAVLAQQRSVFLAFALGAGALLAVHPHRRRAAGALAGAALVAALAAAGLAAGWAAWRPAQPNPFRAFAAKAEGTLAGPAADPTAGFRREAWHEALLRTRAAPVVGEGYGIPFVFAYHPVARPGDPLAEASRRIPLENDIRPHNTYLTVLYKSGTVGLGLLGWLIVTAAARLAAMPRRGWQAAEAGRLGALVLLAAFGALNLLLESPFLAAPTWAALGVLLAGAALPRPKRRTAGAPR